MAVTNVKRLMKKLEDLGGNSEAIFENAVEKAGKAIERYAKDYCPESGLSDDTLRDSIKFEMVTKEGEKTKGRVVTNHEYAAYVEFGTGPVGAKSGGVASKLASQITYKSDGWYIPASEIESAVAEQYKFKLVTIGGVDFYYSEGQVAQPYMYPAVVGKEKTLGNIVRYEIKKEIKKICNSR